MDKKTLDKLLIAEVIILALLAILIGSGTLPFKTGLEGPPELYFPNQDENGFFPICIDGFMAGCTPQGCVPSDPVIECQIITIDLGDLE